MLNKEEFKQKLISEDEPSKRLEVVWAEYENVVGKTINRPPSEEEKIAVEEWFRISGLQLEVYGLVPVLKAFVHTTAFAKSLHLQQHRCSACNQTRHDDNRKFLDICLPIQIDPWSAQSRNDNVLIKEALKEELARERTSSVDTPIDDGPLCATIVALTPRSQRKKDVDNIVKGLLDSMEGILYMNDSQVQCLNIRRVEYAGKIGCYCVRLCTVHPWDCDIIYDSPASPDIVSGKRID